MKSIDISGELTSDAVEQILGVLRPSIGQPKEIRFDSPGGDVAAGLRLYTEFRKDPGKKTAVAYGLVASAAILPWLACDTRIVHESAVLMIHSTWTTTQGNSTQLEQASRMLSTFDQTILSILEIRTGQPRSKFKELFEQGDTFFLGSEAVAMGLATELSTAEAPVRIAASLVGGSARDAQLRHLTARLKSIQCPKERTTFWKANRKVFIR